MLFINLFLSLLPGILIIFFIYRKDKHEQEPYKYIIICVLLGMFSCVPAIAGTLFSKGLIGVKNPGESSDIIIVAIYAFGAVAFSEEFAKFLFLRFYIYPKSEFDEPMDGIVYGVVIGMGFAILENVLYVMQGGLGVALLRMFTAVPGHAAFGVIMGYYVGLAKFEPNHAKSTYMMLNGLILAAVVHGAYDFCLFQKNYVLLTLFAFVVLIMGIRMSLKLIKMHVENSPHREGATDDKNDGFNHLIE